MREVILVCTLFVAAKRHFQNIERSNWHKVYSSRKCFCGGKIPRETGFSQHEENFFPAKHNSSFSHSRSAERAAAAVAWRVTLWLRNAIKGCPPNEAKFGQTQHLASIKRTEKLMNRKSDEAKDTMSTGGDVARSICDCSVRRTSWLYILWLWDKA